MKKLFAGMKKKIEDVCGRKELAYINLFLIVMLLVSVAANIYIVKVNKTVINDGEWFADCYYSGIAMEMGADGKADYYYVVNGAKSNKFTGLAANHVDNELMYFKKGKWDAGFNDVVEFMGESYYVRDGKADPWFSGLVVVEKKAYSIKNGRVDSGSDGIVKINDNYYKLKDGIQDSSFTKFTEVEGIDHEIFFQKGKCSFDSRYLKGDQEDYTIIIDNVVLEDDSYDGLVEDKKGNGYMIAAGKIDKDYEGYVWDSELAKGFLLKNGVTQTDVSELMEFEGEDILRLFENGIFKKNFTGLYEQDGINYYVYKGKCDLTYTDEVKIDDSAYYVENGIVVKEVSTNAK